MNKRLYKALYQVMLSLMRILLRHGVSFGEFNQLSKQSFIQIAEQHLLETEGKATTSRIAIISGLTRKEVSNLRKEASNDVIDSSKYNRAVRVVSGWLDDSTFCSQDGHPKVLLINGEVSFETLVNRYSGDMPVRAMLDELERVGVVEKIGKKHVSLLRHAYVPVGNENEKIAILGVDVALLLSTIDHNLSSDNNDTYFQRKVCYDNLPEECIPEFKKLVTRDSQHLLEKFNEWLAQHDRDRNPDLDGTGKIKAGVGIYYFEEQLSPKDKKQNKG